MRRLTIILFITAALLGFVMVSGYDSKRPRLGQDVGTLEADHSNGPQAARPIKSAATLAGMVTGMAMVCKFNTEPLLQSYKAYLENHKAGLLALDQQELFDLNARSIALGMKMQRADRPMPCSEVQQRMLDTISRLRTA